ncbi:MAG TPA: hypothetical protein VEJ38_04380 [Candidatus Acidoferrales bacterium]|nr:hypothetical protein [Candidatus Acidoferrales bacterium]
MFKPVKSFTGLVLLALAVVVPQSLRAQTQPPPATAKASVTTIVTVLGPSFTAPPALGKSDVIVHTGNRREDVTNWSLAQGDSATLQLAILIDDGATDFDMHLDELRHFIQAQPKSANIGVFYGSNGMTVTVARFSADHDSVAKKVRIAIGPTGTSTSIYLSLIDVLKKLQLLSGRREVLLIADGHDRLRGDLPESPDLDSAMESAQKIGIVVHTLYTRVGRTRRGFNLTLAQSNLTRIAGETGGQAFFQGLETPVSFTPFLNQLDMALHNQYYLTFTTPRSTRLKGELRAFKVATEQHNISITAPSRVLVPGPAR